MPVQWTQVPPLLREDFLCLWAAKPVWPNYSTHAAQLLKPEHPRARALQQGLLLLLSPSSHVRLCAVHRQQPTRLRHPRDSPGKNTGVGCHFLLQCMTVKVKLLRRVRPLATPWTAPYQAPPSMGFSRQAYWSGVPVPSPLQQEKPPQ